MTEETKKKIEIPDIKILESEMEEPVTIKKITRRIQPFSGFLSRVEDIMRPVMVRPCGEEYGGKTFLGFYIGDVIIDVYTYLKEENDELVLLGHNNPAIFIPEFNKVVFGCGSWWGFIKDEEELKQITNEDIQNIWYVQALKILGERLLDEKKGDLDNQR